MVTNSSNEPSTCPYAAAMHLTTANIPTAAGNTSPTIESDDTDSDTGSHETPTSKLIQACPVFQQGSCPFKDCHDETEIRQAMLQIPLSHYQDGTAGGQQFLTVLKEIHAVAGHTPDERFTIPCPVASKLPRSDSRGTALNFTQAMEGYSLSVIMARMASDIEDNGLNTALDEDHSKNNEMVSQDKSKLLPEEKDNSSRVRNNNVEETITNATDKKQGRSEKHTLLSESFKTGTAVSHQAAEDVHFVRNFIKGEIDRTIYAELVVQLYHVYEQLEKCLLPQEEPSSLVHLKTHPALEQFRTFHEKLRRTPALQEDLDFWHGPVETSKIVNNGAGLSAAAADYRNRLVDCTTRDPLLLLAHSYTRYLGDLSGGKILARVARRAMNLDRDGDGLAFYEFQHIPSAKKFKDDFRQALDELELTEEEIQRLVAEANVAFLLNMRLFEELDVRANVPGAKVRPLAEALAFQNGTSVDVTKTAGNGECPFAKPTAVKEGVCPFVKANGNGTDTVSVREEIKKGRCPWPFIMAHDPVASLRDWQTWALIGLLLCWCYSTLH